METYRKPEMEVIAFDGEIVVTTSCTLVQDDSGPWTDGNDC